VPHEETPEIYGIVLDAALPLLPAELRAFLEPRRAQVMHAAVQARSDNGHYAEIKRVEAPRRDALVVDVVCQEKADFNTPHYDAEGLRSCLGNELEVLEKAFRGDAKVELEDAIGTLLHFATDAAMPFHYIGQINDDRDVPDEPLEDSAFGPPKFQDMFNEAHAIVTRFEPQFRARVHVDPSRIRSKVDPRETVRVVIQDAIHRSEFLRRISLSILRSSSPDDMTPVGAEALINRYFEQLARRGGWIIEECIESAAILNVELIAHAWSKAGGRLPAGVGKSESSPPPTVVIPQPPKAASKEAAIAAPFVGSRNSTVVHRADCSHVDRMRPENRVLFSSLEQAKSAGRTPCKSCLSEQKP